MFLKFISLSLCVFLPVLYTLPLIKSANAEILRKCGKYASVKVGRGSNSYSVHNNIWNDRTKSHCIEVNRDSGAFRIVSSNHDKSTFGSPAGYSFINKGCHWGICTHVKGEMPRQVSTILEARSSWNTTQKATGIYNVAYDIWFHRNPVAISQPDGAELMIWLTSKGNIQPVGSLRGSEVPISDAKWNVWAGWNGVNNVISYVRTNSVETVSDLNIKAFIVDSISRGYVQNDWYLISIGAGFEIWKDGKGLASNSFSLQLE